MRKKKRGRTDIRGGEGALLCILHHSVIPKTRPKTYSYAERSAQPHVLLLNHEVWRMKACIISGTWSWHGGLIRSLQAWTFTRLLPTEGLYIYFSGNKLKQVIFQNPNAVFCWFDWLDFVGGWVIWHFFFVCIAASSATFNNLHNLIAVYFTSNKWHQSVIGRFWIVICRSVCSHP